MSPIPLSKSQIYQSIKLKENIKSCYIKEIYKLLFDCQYLTLQVLEISQYSLSFLKLNGFQYTLQKNIPIMTQQIAQQVNLKLYILPGVDQFFYGIVVDLKHKDIDEVFQYYLSQKCNLVQPKSEVFGFFNPKEIQQQNLKEIPEEKKLSQEDCMMKSGVVQVNQQNMWENVGKGQKKSVTLSNYIVKGGQFVKEGLITGAGYLASGIKSGGQYIQDKITTTEQKEIDPSTIQKVKLANTGSKAMVIYTKAQVEALVKLGMTVGEEAGKQFANSENGQKIAKHENYEDAKNIGLATLNAFVTVYDGMYEALGQLGNTFAEATTGIIEKKYGNQAGELSKESFGVVGNVGQITRAYKDAAAKAVIQETSKEQQQK